MVKKLSDIVYTHTRKETPLMVLSSFFSEGILLLFFLSSYSSKISLCAGNKTNHRYIYIFRHGIDGFFSLKKENIYKSI